MSGALCDLRRFKNARLPAPVLRGCLDLFWSSFSTHRLQRPKYQSASKVPRSLRSPWDWSIGTAIFSLVRYFVQIPKRYFVHRTDIGTSASAHCFWSVSENTREPVPKPNRVPCRELPNAILPTELRTFKSCFIDRATYLVIFLIARIDSYFAPNFRECLRKRKHPSAIKWSYVKSNIYAKSVRFVAPLAFFVVIYILLVFRLCFRCYCVRRRPYLYDFVKNTFALCKNFIVQTLYCCEPV